MTRVLVVDDSALIRRFLARLLEAEGGFEVMAARDGIEALQVIGSFRPDVVTLDVEMPNMDGLACLDRIMVEHPCPVVMVSALTRHGADETLEALEMGAVDFVAKPRGTISLHEEEFAPLLLDRVRTAASVNIRKSARLSDRLRFRAGKAPTGPAARQKPSPARARPAALPGDSLVLVGASTGGPPAIDTLLTSLPADFPWPILVAQHMPATFTASFAGRLNGLAALEVTEVTRPTPLERGGVYIARGDADMLVSRRGDRLVAMPAPASQDHRWHPSVARLVSSAMQCCPAEKLLGVLMTGMGDDGAAEMAELKAAGGHTIAESEETAVVWGMPGELVRREGASDILPLPKIAPRLLGLCP